LDKEFIPNSNTLIAKTFHGLENLLAEELRLLGAENIELITRGVAFEASQEILYRANLQLRTALRIIKPIAHFEARNAEELYEGVSKTNWEEHFGINDTFTIDSVVNSPLFPHSGFVALKAKDAIVDQFRAKIDARPSIDNENPTIRINLHISNILCTLSLDSSGEPLFKRGYRIEREEAPLNEVLAAGMLMLSSWDKKTPLYDPMCGVGTILTEAKLLANNIAPCILRKNFGFQKWKNYDETLWKSIVKEANEVYQAQKSNSEPLLYGSDVSPRAVHKADENFTKLQMRKHVKLSIKEFAIIEKPVPKGIIVMNPPYGERMKVTDIQQFYGAVGERLKHHFSGWEAWILTSNDLGIKNIGLKPSRRIPLFNGAIECKYLNYKMYEGSKRHRNPESEMAQNM